MGAEIARAASGDGLRRTREGRIGRGRREPAGRLSADDEEAVQAGGASRIRNPADDSAAAGDEDDAEAVEGPRGGGRREFLRPTSVWRGGPPGRSRAPGAMTTTGSEST